MEVSFWSVLALVIVTAQFVWVVRVMQHRCPFCSDSGVADVDRHVKIFHPDRVWDWPLDPDDRRFGVDPRPDEDPRNALHGRIREWSERNSRKL